MSNDTHDEVAGDLGAGGRADDLWRRVEPLEALGRDDGALAQDGPDAELLEALEDCVRWVSPGSAGSRAQELRKRARRTVVVHLHVEVRQQLRSAVEQRDVLVRVQLFDVGRELDAERAAAANEDLATLGKLATLSASARRRAMPPALLPSASERSTGAGSLPPSAYRQNEKGIVSCSVEPAIRTTACDASSERSVDWT